MGEEELPTATASERDELIAYIRSLGGTDEEIGRSTTLSDLVVDLQLRPRSGETLGGVVARAGLEWDELERLLAATGLPVDPSAPVSAGEAAMIEALAGVRAALLGDDATVQLVRVARSSMARVAEAVVMAFRLQFELPRRAAGTRYIEVVEEYGGVIETWLPPFVDILDVLLRREIVAVADRMWSTDAEQTAVTLERAMGFADLVGYTERSSTLSARDLAAALVDFEERAAGVVAAGGGQMVKTIGDEAMFVSEDVAGACRIGAALVEAFAGTPLPVRVGIAAGEVVSVLGDVYGRDVNLAARLVGVADPSSVVVSAAVYDHCRERFAFEELEPLALKGFAEPVVAYRLDLGSAG